MKKKLTLTIDKSVSEKAKRLAKREGTSVSPVGGTAADRKNRFCIRVAASAGVMDAKNAGGRRSAGSKKL